jgi:hypothetical protein
MATIFYKKQRFFLATSLPRPAGTHTANRARAAALESYLLGGVGAVLLPVQGQLLHVGVELRALRIRGGGRSVHHPGRLQLPRKKGTVSATASPRSWKREPPAWKT